jgi:valyl-tRNA synthetase
MNQPIPEHLTYEPAMQELWRKAGAATPAAAGEPYAMIMPPPNITGSLHLGHATFLALQDAITRHARLEGKAALWLPGTDHASIGASYMLERELRAQGTNRTALGREAYLARMWAFAAANRERIRGQITRFGALTDWGRERFTLDESATRATRAAFSIMAERGLLERRRTMITWCVGCGTAISDLETDIIETARPMYTLRYPLLDDSGAGDGDFIEIATTRPETIFADAAIALAPGHPRSDLAGRSASIPLSGRAIPILIDEAADLATGTGALKITPAHDLADAAAGARHGLAALEAIGPDGRLTDLAGRFAGLSREQGRAETLGALRAGGYLIGETPTTSALPHCGRCGRIVEHRPGSGWFALMAPPAQALLARLDARELEIIPAHEEANLRHWLEGIHDWNLSRQLWWGQPIPAWYCGDGHTSTPIAPYFADPDRCSTCGSAALEQDPDTLDTWFTSALWPFAALGWPDGGSDFERFYPNAILETGRDILFFWAARMLMLGLELTGELPFRTLYLHGLLRDAGGHKMSKTAGNGADLDAMAAQYGYDALRWALLEGNSAGTDFRLRPERFEASRRLGNKMANAGRFMSTCGATSAPAEFCLEDLSQEERSALASAATFAGNYRGAMEAHRFSEAADALRESFWHSFCDRHLELAKRRLAAESGCSPAQRRATQGALGAAWRLYLTCAHPWWPHLSEWLWQVLEGRREPILASSSYASALAGLSG